MSAESDQSDIPMHAKTREDINYLLKNGYETDDGKNPAPKNKPITRGNNEQPIYKYGWYWNVIDYRKALIC